MHVVVIGGTGHIGTYLSPSLIEAGHRITSVTRGLRAPYQPHPAWQQIATVEMNRAEEESHQNFGRRILALSADVVIDLTCYTVESARQLVEALSGNVRHFLHCGTIWVHGAMAGQPTSEDSATEPFGDYGCRKAAIEKYLKDQHQRSGFPVTVIHPGHLVGPGWTPINPAGNFNLQVFSDLAAGREVLLPNQGIETLHHVHAADVAQAFVRAIASPAAAIGESFHAVSPAPLAMREYAGAMAVWFGRTPRLRFLPWEEWSAAFSEKDARITWDHLAHSPNCSIRKARAGLGYCPQYDSLSAVQESVSWLIAHHSIQTLK